MNLFFINKKDNICILGDYDVDGISSTSLLIRYFKHIKQQYFYYIPDRVSDGYGASKNLFKNCWIGRKRRNLVSGTL